MPALKQRAVVMTRVALFGLMATALAACQLGGSTTGGSTWTDPGGGTPAPGPRLTETPPAVKGGIAYTAEQIRNAYDVTPLFDKGDQGQGQTIVFIESYGSPTLQQDLAVFDRQYGLPTPNLQIIAPLGAPPLPNNPDVQGWAFETTLDVEGAHAIAPKANLVVLTSPVDETEGVQGLPEFLQLEQYAVDHHLGTIISQSWVASDVSLTDATSQSVIAQWNTFLQQAATQDHVTFLGGSGDWGGTQCLTYNQSQGQCSVWSKVATSGFPADSPYDTAVGGTSLSINGSNYQESVWNSYGDASGGGFSRFYAEPDFQKGLPTSIQSQLDNRRGVPDVAAAADPRAELAVYATPEGGWVTTGGTSAAAPLWAGVIAIANQVAGRPLGWINPALYKIAASSQYHSAFRDITTGNSDVTLGGSPLGYTAAPGWDAATGLGSPDVANLVPLLIQNIPA